MRKIHEKRIRRAAREVRESKEGATSRKTSMLMTSQVRCRLRMDTYGSNVVLAGGLEKSFGVVVGGAESPIAGEKLRKLDYSFFF